MEIKTKVFKDIFSNDILIVGEAGIIIRRGNLFPFPSFNGSFYTDKILLYSEIASIDSYPAIPLINRGFIHFIMKGDTRHWITGWLASCYYILEPLFVWYSFMGNNQFKEALVLIQQRMNGSPAITQKQIDLLHALAPYQKRSWVGILLSYGILLISVFVIYIFGINILYGIGDILKFISNLFPELDPLALFIPLFILMIIIFQIVPMFLNFIGNIYITRKQIQQLNKEISDLERSS